MNYIPESNVISNKFSRESEKEVFNPEFKKEVNDVLVGPPEVVLSILILKSPTLEFVLKLPCLLVLEDWIG